MTYFRERENLKTDYSGYQEASHSLRDRLNTVCHMYLTMRMDIQQMGYRIPILQLEHELKIILEESNITNIIFQKSYEYVFEAIEIYLTLAKKYAKKVFYEQILPDMQRTFTLSGSVYFIDNKGQINLKIDEKLAENLEGTKSILIENHVAYKTLFDAVANLVARKESPDNIIKDIFIAFEGYLKEKTTKKNFGEASLYLKNKKILTSVQAVFLDKLYAYRSDSFKVAHAGNSEKPAEPEAIWFLETVVAQLKFIDIKLRETGDGSLGATP